MEEVGTLLTATQTVGFVPCRSRRKCEIVREPKLNFPNPKPQSRSIDRRSRPVRMLRHVLFG